MGEHTQFGRVKRIFGGFCHANELASGKGETRGWERTTARKVKNRRIGCQCHSDRVDRFWLPPPRTRAPSEFIYQLGLSLLELGYSIFGYPIEPVAGAEPGA